MTLTYGLSLVLGALFLTVNLMVPAVACVLVCLALLGWAWAVDFSKS